MHFQYSSSESVFSLYLIEQRNKVNFKLRQLPSGFFLIICSIIIMIVIVSEEMCQSVNNKKKCKHFYTDHVREVKKHYFTSTFFSIDIFRCAYPSLKSNFNTMISTETFQQKSYMFCSITIY